MVQYLQQNNQNKYVFMYGEMKVKHHRLVYDVKAPER